MPDHILLPVLVEGINPRKDRSWKMTFSTGRELNGSEVSVLVDNFQGEGWLQFSPNQVMPPPPDDPADAGVKSPSERLRSHLYALWQQQGAKASFNAFYGAKMDALCQQVRDLLDKGDV